MSAHSNVPASKAYLALSLTSVAEPRIPQPHSADTPPLLQSLSNDEDADEDSGRTQPRAKRSRLDGATDASKTRQYERTEVHEGEDDSAATPHSPDRSAAAVAAPAQPKRKQPTPYSAESSAAAAAAPADYDDGDSAAAPYASSSSAAAAAASPYRPYSTYPATPYASSSSAAAAAASPYSPYHAAATSSSAAAAAASVDFDDDDETVEAPKSPQDMGLTPVVLPPPKGRGAAAAAAAAEADDSESDTDYDYDDENSEADDDEEDTVSPSAAAAAAAPASSDVRRSRRGQGLPAEFSGDMANTHASRKGGSMKSLRTVADTDDAPQNLLNHYTSQLGGLGQDPRGLFYSGPLEVRGLGKQRVKARVPDRDKGLHTTKFRAMTGGESSSTQYQTDLGTAKAGTKYQILHGMGHGEGGADTQVPDNLASASSGANTEMIPPDKAISGNTEVSVDTRFSVRAGTHRAERISMQYYHDADPAIPFYSNTIDGDRPEMTRSEYDREEEEVAWMKDPDELRTAVQQRRANRINLHRDLLAHPRFNPVGAAAAAAPTASSSAASHHPSGTI